MLLNTLFIVMILIILLNSNLPSYVFLLPLLIFSSNIKVFIIYKYASKVHKIQIYMFAIKERTGLNNFFVITNKIIKFIREMESIFLGFSQYNYYFSPPSDSNFLKIIYELINCLNIKNSSYNSSIVDKIELKNVAYPEIDF